MKFWSTEIDEFFAIGYNLHELGVNNWALKKHEALTALKQLLILQVPILGGDVYEKHNGNIQQNYDNWYCNKLDDESKIDFIDRSIKIAIDYIENYNIQDEEFILFTLVPEI
ncbi:MAG: hypothetical protein COA88_02170 [Kordia sp.]|nr:MAG: hypothetical protein COA88_02170 [Kordia sp.]